MVVSHVPCCPRSILAKAQLSFLPPAPAPAPTPSKFIPSKTLANSIKNNSQKIPSHGDEKQELIPTMSEIMASARAQNVRLELRTLGPLFRISARNWETKQEVGRAEGLIKVWFGGRILHLDSIRMRRETLQMQKSIFGLGLFVGAVAVRHGFDCGCRKAELLAINDSDLYHSKLVRFYTRIGFKAVHEVSGSSISDLAHMLVWGGKGTRMDADVEELMVKWGRRFKAQN